MFFVLGAVFFKPSRGMLPLRQLPQAIKPSDAQQMLV